MPEMRSVDSSNVAAVGYDEEARVMRVRFHSGGVYNYYDVEPEVYHTVLYSDSPGGSLHQNVKGRYDYRRIGGLRRAAERLRG